MFTEETSQEVCTLILAHDSHFLPVADLRGLGRLNPLGPANIEVISASNPIGAVKWGLQPGGLPRLNAAALNFQAVVFHAVCSLRCQRKVTSKLLVTCDMLLPCRSDSLASSSAVLCYVNTVLESGRELL